MKGLNDRTARLTEQEEKNFKILKWFVMGLCIAVPITLYAMLMIGKHKVFEKRQGKGNTGPHFARNCEIMYWVFASIIIILHLMYAFFLLAAVFIIKKSLQKESVAHKIDLKMFWINAIAFILAVIPIIFYIFYYYLWSREFYLDHSILIDNPD